MLGADGPLGRDELLRLLYGGQVSLEVAIAATLLALAIGTLLGSAAAYFGGRIDAVISRFTDLVMAFPILLFVIMLGSTVAPRIDGITLHGLLAACSPWRCRSARSRGSTRHGSCARRRSRCAAASSSRRRR